MFKISGKHTILLKNIHRVVLHILTWDEKTMDKTENHFLRNHKHKVVFTTYYYTAQPRPSPGDTSYNKFVNSTG